MALMLTVAGCIEMPCRIINGLIADRCFISALSHLGLCMAVTATCAVICITVPCIVGMYKLFKFYISCLCIEISACSIFILLTLSKISIFHIVILW